MRRILLILLIVVAAWALWWPVAAWREVAATEAWLEERRDAGWQADWADVEVTGFPLAYSRRIVSPALADPGTGWAWSAPELRLARARHPALAQPGLVVSFPGEQTLRTPRQRIDVVGGLLRAELLLEGPEDRLGGATVEAQALGLVSDTGWRAALGAGRLTLLATDEAPEVVAVTLSAQDLALPRAVQEAAGDGIAPDVLGRIEAEAVVTFDRPWDIAALQTARPQPERIEVDDAALRWGQLELRVAGTLDVAADGTPEGELLVKATNWRDLLGAARAAGALPEGVAGAVERALDLASRLAGRSDTLDVPLRFAEGRVRLGPVPIGRAPVLSLP